jgi:ribosome-associated protein
MPDIRKEITYKTSRSGGSGGQHVNKTETQVEASWDLLTSAIITEDERLVLLAKLRNRLTADGVLSVKCQETRSQLDNKQRAAQRLEQLVNAALVPQKQRKASKPTRASVEKRIQAKKKASERKQQRRKDFGM